LDHESLNNSKLEVKSIGKKYYGEREEGKEEEERRGRVPLEDQSFQRENQDEQATKQKKINDDQ
jgi:hypothetical protein